MRASTAENLASLYRSAARLAVGRSATTAASAAKKKPPSSSRSADAAASKKKKKKKKTPTPSSPAKDDALKEYLSSIKSSSSSKAKCLLKNFKAPPSSSTLSTLPSSSLRAIVGDSLNSGCGDGDDESAKQLAAHASSMLYDEMDLDWDDEYQGESVGTVLDLPWLSRMSNINISLRRKEVSRERKQKWVFKNAQTSRFGRLVKMCAKKLGPDATIEVFGKLGRETGLKEYNALIKVFIETARGTTDEDVSLEQIYKAYQILRLVRENGFKIEEETYGQFLMYLIDFGMVEEFFFFHELIKHENPDSLPRLAYYEMLLWIRVNNEEKIQEHCRSIVADDAEEKSELRECLLPALAEGDRKQEFLMLLETLDITKVTSVVSLESVFRSLGKLSLEPHAERFLLVLKRSDTGAGNISNSICEYALGLPNLAVEDIIMKFQMLHQKLEMLPTSAQYEKLVRYCCEFLKVHEALDVVAEAFKSGVALSLEIFHSILDACDQSCEFNLVHPINSTISCYNVKPNTETFRRMILLCVKMKDFEGAYGLINDLERMNLKPTASMYNCILSGYFRQKDIQSARNVLKQMEDADVKPDALTYSCLIANSHCEKDIIKFYDDMRKSEFNPQNSFMALTNAYASCDYLKMLNRRVILCFCNTILFISVQIILDKRIPVKNLNEIKSVLIGALASNGELAGALELYEEIKEAKCDLNPKAIKSLIEHFQSEGELNKSLQLLEELNNSPYWIHACFTVISYCVQHENLRSTVDLLKKLKDKFINAEVNPETLFDEVFCLYAEKESTDVQFGLDLLQAVKEELCVQPSRKSLDFLLSACANAKDSKASFVIWKEYETADLPYNVLSYVRMYQALLASGDTKSAAKILSKMPKDDPHVRCVVKACEATYIKSPAVEKKKKKKKKALMATLGILDGLEAKTE
ncbi:Pentatricopeptide repeat-containing protein, mitochondrial [Sesamum alatum]|uniref:Pentatricopeptide repeat-containing protein, mitochondrial n=1 Tax=Sesamum alatum TaxID=300844 RepID=A0AAE1XZ16_9LAMI|nr:Pentatricopeptide repeat-containing protein, mitochondrial [Sesamum alatum]